MAGLLMVLVLAGAVAYAVDWFVSRDKVPRNVTVAAVEIGGLSPEDARQRLEAELVPRASEPFVVIADEMESSILPDEAGLALDIEATVDQASRQPLNPVTRLADLFRTREVGFASTVDGARLEAVVDEVKAAVDEEAVEGDIVFVDGAPQLIQPRDGLIVPADEARATIVERWLFPEPVRLPVQVEEVTVTEEGLDAALTEFAQPAVSSNLVIRGKDGAEAVLAPEEMGDVVSFAPDGDGGLEPEYSVDAARRALAPQLRETEVPPVEATVRIGDDGPEVVPDQVGTTVDWDATLADLPELMQRVEGRTVDAVYEDTQAEFTTADAEALGIEEVIGEFTTGGFASASGVNIRQAAEETNGAIIEPGETFSLNNHTGTRSYAQGYVDSGIILGGRPSTAVGGGVSQFATTLYNAAYFAGLEDVDHTEHSYYISRYPAGREATVFEGSIDLQFRNQYDTGVLIQSFGDQSSVTVRMWGTKTVDVESVNGGRWDYTSPPRITLREGPNCQPSAGGQGFTTSDTRIIRDADSGDEISRETRTVRYVPQPEVVCEAPPPPPPPSDDDEGDNGDEGEERPSEEPEPSEPEPSEPAPPAEPAPSEPAPPAEG
ncbi:VanW family protein [Lolliginicoccus levis]|uniref:VanW family protein n=1 Tax=Lolliginicoccus levis TaxID=2919542 RepID=UPI00241E90D8|nr:VanW family protein [Lolliginicoccus levis]